MMRTPDFTELVDIIERYIVTNTMDTMEDWYECRTKQGCLDNYENQSYREFDDLVENIGDRVNWDRVHEMIRRRINGRFLKKEE